MESRDSNQIFMKWTELWLWQGQILNKVLKKATSLMQMLS